jgi:YVTN family beta-propeller protein
MILCRLAIGYASLFVIACNSGTDPGSTPQPPAPPPPPGPLSITISAPAEPVFETESARLTAVVRDTMGAVVNAPVTFEVRDPTLATMSGDMFTGQLSGTTWVVASAGPATARSRDSVAVTTVFQRVRKGGRPLGAAISKDGIVMTTLLDEAKVAYDDLLPRPNFEKTIDVGLVPTDVQFNNAGTRAYVANQFSQSISIIDVGTMKVTDQLAVTGNPFRVFVPQGDSVLWVLTNADYAYAFRLRTKELINSFPTGGTANGFVANGSKMWISTRAGATILEVSLVTHAVLRTFVVGGLPQDLATSDDGQRLYIANEAGYLQVWDIAGNREIRRISLPGGGGYGMARSPGSDHLYLTTSYFSRTVWVINPETGHRIREIVVRGVPRRVAFSAQGSHGIIPNENGWIDLIR